MNPDELKVAIETYFTGEARVMYVFLTIAALLIATACPLWFAIGDRFSIALRAGIALFALILGVTGSYLLVRDSEIRSELLAAAENSDRDAVAGKKKAGRGDDRQFPALSLAGYRTHRLWALVAPYAAWPCH